ncbi:MAG: hypothetical protein EZS28_017078 [Streblomastix strix]|uniref:Uncharacterized protein n=1 Tax=Streblomastix strix TaxID=222440 RepID=A0A5J4VXR8_9EUKA|nr:MAG: hypothetical protein EZS28_017078 [Streblomastix strix]
MAGLFTCPICLQEAQKPCLSPCCTQVFCMRCAAQWLADVPQCPYCRRTLRYNDLIPINRLSSFINDKISSLLTEKEKQELKCQQHPSKTKDYYCRSCRILICPDCAIISPDHKGHDVCSASEAAEQCKLDLMNTVDNISYRSEELKELKQKLCMKSSERLRIQQIEFSLISTMVQSLQKEMDKEIEKVKDSEKQNQGEIEKFETELIKVQSDIREALIKTQGLDLVQKRESLYQQGKKVVSLSRLFERSVLEQLRIGSGANNQQQIFSLSLDNKLNSSSLSSSSSSSTSQLQPINHPSQLSSSTTKQIQTLSTSALPTIGNIPNQQQLSSNSSFALRHVLDYDNPIVPPFTFFEFTLQNVFSCAVSGKFVFSPHYSQVPLPHKWRLKVFPNGNDEANKQTNLLSTTRSKQQWMSIFLHLTDTFQLSQFNFITNIDRPDENDSQNSVPPLFYFTQPFYYEWKIGILPSDRWTDAPLRPCTAVSSQQQQQQQQQQSTQSSQSMKGSVSQTSPLVSTSPIIQQQQPNKPMLQAPYSSSVFYEEGVYFKGGISCFEKKKSYGFANYITHEELSNGNFIKKQENDGISGIGAFIGSDTLEFSKDKSKTYSYTPSSNSSSTSNAVQSSSSESIRFIVGVRCPSYHQLSDEWQALHLIRSSPFSAITSSSSTTSTTNSNFPLTAQSPISAKSPQTTQQDQLKKQNHSNSVSPKNVNSNNQQSNDGGIKTTTKPNAK